MTRISVFERYCMEIFLSVLRTVGIVAGTVLALGLLIFVHELGHYLTARACHVTVTEFALGMGKRLCGFTSKKTGIQYSLRLFPIGGYVSMVGEDAADDASKQDPNAFCKKKLWQRMIILVAGAFMNILTGFLAMLILTVGMFAAGYRMPSATVAEFADKAVSQSYGLREGDTVVKVNRVPIHTGYDLTYEITNAGYRPLDLTVERNGERIVLEQVTFGVIEEDGIKLGDMDFIVYAMESTFPNVMRVAWYRSLSSVKMVIDSIGGLLTGRFGIDAMTGPVGMTSVVSEVAQSSMAGWNLLYLFSVIAVNLGIMNLLPLPALDGGRLLFCFIELIRFGKPVSPRVEAAIHRVGIIVLLLFTVLIACKDVIGLFR